MSRRLVLLLLLPLAFVPVQDRLQLVLGEAAGPARHDHRPATLLVSTALQQPMGVLVADTCADGTLAHDEVGGAAGVALRNIQVQLWDRDASSADDLLDTDLTGAAGNFLLCSATEDLDDSANDGLDLYVRVVAENGFWRVQNAEAYQFNLTAAPNLPPGTTHHYGQAKPGAGTPQAGALQIFNAVDRLWTWTASQHVNDCWDALDHKPPNDYSRCRQVVIEWRPDSTTSGFYDSTLNRVHLNGVDFKWRDSVVRETAKSILDDLFDDDYPDTQNCGGRTSIGQQTTRNCAWVEGFADWVAVQVFADPVLDWQVGTQVFHENLETASWDTAGWDYGDAVEGRVAGALLDMSDATNDAPWDRLAQGPNPVWTKLLNQSWSQRYHEFAALGFSGDNALATLYQNTIDYGLRDPLANGVPVSRRVPSPPHNFRFTTTNDAWSVVAIRPPAGADYDLRLFGTSNPSGTPLASSNLGGPAADLVVIDSNPGKRPLGTFYPQAYQYSGTGNYDIKFVQTMGNFGVGQTATAVMTTGNPVAIWETVIGASASVKIEVAQPAGMNAELFLFCSTTTPSTWIKGRAAAAAAAPQLASGTETLTWTAPAIAPGYCAVVLINKSGSGTYTVTRKS